MVDTPSMRDILHALFEQRTLDTDTARALVLGMGRQAYSENEMAACLGAFGSRSVTVQELAGFREAMIELCHRVDLSDYDPIDLCGTGGDGKNTFNVSTAASFVVAAAGIPVAKHGNYGVSSVCGSSNVLEALGVTFATDEAGLKAQLDAGGICFLHAPLFHPAMKCIAPVRRSLGVATFFNMLGPIVNPASPRQQLIGVNSLGLARLYSYTLQRQDSAFTIVHSLDGYDEISLTGVSRLLSRNGTRDIAAETFGCDRLAPEALHGGDSVAEASALFRTVLSGSGTDAQTHVVAANAAAAMHVAKPEMELREGFDTAVQLIRGGKAMRVLEAVTAIRG